MRNPTFAAVLVVSLVAPLARADDEADVKAVAMTVVTAVASGDHNTLADNFADTGPDEQLADSMSDVIAASKTLREAEVSKFGAAANKTMQFDPKKLVDDAKNATVKVTGDTAELTPANPAAPAHSGMQFKRVGGVWKVVSLTGQTGGRLVMLKILKPMATAMNDTAAEVTAGKYASAAEAEQAVKAKVVADMKKSGIVPATPTKPPAKTPSNGQ